MTKSPDDAALDRAANVADLIGAIAMMASAGSDEDQGAVLFGVWIDLTHALVRLGWTADELVMDCRRYAEAEAEARP